MSITERPPATGLSLTLSDEHNMIQQMAREHSVEI